MFKQFKIPIWILTVIYFGVCLTVWVSFLWAMHQLAGFNFAALPGLTVFVFQHTKLILFYPLPWLISASVLSRRETLSRKTFLLFLLTGVAAIFLLILCVSWAAIWPYFLLKM